MCCQPNVVGTMDESFARALRTMRSFTVDRRCAAPGGESSALPGHILFGYAEVDLDNVGCRRRQAHDRRKDPGRIGSASGGELIATKCVVSKRCCNPGTSGRGQRFKSPQN